MTEPELGVLDHLGLVHDSCGIYASVRPKIAQTSGDFRAQSRPEQVASSVLATSMTLVRMYGIFTARCILEGYKNDAKNHC